VNTNQKYRMAQLIAQAISEYLPEQFVYPEMAMSLAEYIVDELDEASQNAEDEVPA
jgi:hypothetical protein